MNEKFCYFIVAGFAVGVNALPLDLAYVFTGALLIHLRFAPFAAGSQVVAYALACVCCRGFSFGFELRF